MQSFSPANPAVKRRPDFYETEMVGDVEQFFGEASCSFEMALSNFLLFRFQHGSHRFPVSGLYFPSRNSGTKTGRDRIHVANVLRDASGTVLIGGGLGYFISYEAGSFLAQCINFPLQRNITFRSKGNPFYQAFWYLIAWIFISLICNGFNNLWMPIASAYVSPAVYNILVTMITGGVSMIIFFFAFKIIFPEGEKRKAQA